MSITYVALMLSYCRTVFKTTPQFTKRRCWKHVDQNEKRPKKLYKQEIPQSSESNNSAYDAGFVFSQILIRFCHGCLISSIRPKYECREWQTSLVWRKTTKNWCGIWHPFSLARIRFFFCSRTSCISEGSPSTCSMTFLVAMVDNFLPLVPINTTST